MASNNRTSTYTTTSDHDRPKSADAKKDMWSSMLDSVASGKHLPEKNILVLGGTPESQREFLESLSTDESRRAGDRQNSKQPPIANNFALGYTYHDVLDADHEDILARLSIYLLSDPSPSFTPLLQPLLTPQTIPNTLIVVLLDWSQPWFWLRQLRDWIRLLRTLLVSLDADCKEKMEEVMISWRDRGRGGNSLDGGGSSSTAESDVSLPLGPGEWEEALGLPLCVICQNSDRIEVLERERSWKEEEFDFVLQFLRTVLLKHGASLIYTIPSVTSPLQSLVHASLGIHSLLKREPLKHNVIDRDKVLVPPNWDSWGKIRVLRDGFDVEAINKGWSLDIEETDNFVPEPQTNGTDDHPATDEDVPQIEGGAVEVYEENIRDPSLDALQAASGENSGHKLEVSSLDTQSFLGTQLEVLDKIRNDSSGMDSSRLVRGRQMSQSTVEDGEGSPTDEGRVNEHIGPVQFNMGGIQVDADDMLQRLKDRQSYQTPEPETPMGGSDGKNQNDALASFFAGLMKRGGGSAASSPKPGAS
ncbi:related to dynein light intermediate chain 2 [Phialocephala subalpina]|uniref:Related to dynein light intermediate chain 2 n=1 Tax=Phialocephala subalpina TaxID=576137 RepID=A0A1L7XFP9_9HELO|nr:related to dynein light intermediate chain 2 [Phialocephala subalpina]